jgi:hypothetical protein
MLLRRESVEPPMSQIGQNWQCSDRAESCRLSRPKKTLNAFARRAGRVV